MHHVHACMQELKSVAETQNKIKIGSKLNYYYEI